MHAYERGDQKVARALHGIRTVAESMGNALVAADIAQIGRLMSENWKHQLALDPQMRTEKMAQLEESVLAAGALGGKAAGSGAGGCMFFLAPDEPGRVIEAAQRCGVTVLPVRWAMYGVRQC
jgi:galactokinase/mevalonate kinase-like predicted kinase